MMIICEDNRLEIENEFMALILNKNNIIPLLQIDYSYLYDQDNRAILKAAIECYKKYEVVTPKGLQAIDNTIDLDRYVELLADTFYHPEAWEKQLRLSEESILKFYKEDVIKALNNKLERKEIDYDEFVRKINEIKQVQLKEETTSLTSQEILSNIGEGAKIEIKRFSKLDYRLKLVQGDFLIIGATTGTGKSSFLLNLMEGFMNDYQCIYFNMEMSKSTIYKRLISIKANMPIKDVLNPQTNEDKEKVLKAAEDIERAGIVVEHKSTGMRDIRSVVVKNKKPDKHTIVFIDLLGLTRSEKKKKKKSLYEQMTEVAKDIRQMCLEEDCTVIGASQFNREAYSTDDYSLAMLKDSGELENSASKVIFIHRPKDNEGKIVTNVELNLEIAKNRDGMLGFIKMEYDKEKQIFRERYD